ncbi:hypothetical protein [Kamptonema formosum]|uniref:hypothetical protein n=1 Tax=Kamptonema formosum TaxID=331992 RepID=UPI0003821E65|nr:hypothetical protein [Oscillatoria sp. PCC 10802]
MNPQLQIPDPQMRERSVARWREVNQQIDLLTLQLDELIAIVEIGLREQRLARLQGKGKGQKAETVKGC